MNDGLGERTVQSAKWTYAAAFFSASMQVVVTAVLARLLNAADFGVVALAMLVMRFGQYFARMGIGQAIVQRKELTEKHLAAAFWLSVGVGGAFALLAVLCAPLAANAFNTPALQDVLPWMSLSFLIAGVSATSFGLLQRKMEFKAISLVESLAYLVGYGGAIALALAGAGVWSLVFASLSQAFVGSVAYNFLAKPVFRPTLRAKAYRDLLGFGSGISVISFMEFLGSNLDTMVVARLAGPTVLGFYTRALSLSTLPMHYMSSALSRVLLPSFSRMQTDIRRTGRAYLEVVTLFASVGMPMAAGMAGAAPEIVGVLLGPGWEPSVTVLRIVPLAAVAAMLAHFGGVLFDATAQLRVKFWLRLGQILFLVAMLYALSALGLIGFALAFALSELIHLIAQTIVLRRALRLTWRDVIGAYLPSAASSIAIGLTVFGLSSFADYLNLSPVVALLTEVAVAGALLLVSIVLLGRGRVWRMIRLRLGSVPIGVVERILRSFDRFVAERSPQ